ncbi:MAG: hypothetical protein ACKVTZ_07530 [Bacteroidia bacterium]
MKKFAWLFSFFLVFMANQVSAQSKFEFLPHYGFMYQVISIQPADEATRTALNWSEDQPPQILYYPTLHLGGYMPFYHKNDIFSVGLDAAFQGGINFRPTGLGYQIQVPVFLTARVGANATSYNEQLLGISAGVGAIPTYWNEPSLKAKNFVPIPSANIDVTFNNRGNKVIGRINFPIFPYKSKSFQYNGEKYPFQVSMIGLGLLYGF